MSEGGKGGIKGVEMFPPVEQGKARDKAGERMHVSGRTVDEASQSAAMKVLAASSA